MISDALRADLAPNGRLRAGVNHANTVIATKDAVTGELRGVSVDLVRELARRLEVPLELTGYDYSGGIVEALLDGTIDVGGIAGGAGSGREDALDFTGGYLQLEVTFIAGPSSMEVILEVDKRGGLFTEGRDAFNRFVVDFSNFQQVDWEGHLHNVVAQMSQRRGIF